jgi:hypothetical protein
MTLGAVVAAILDNRCYAASFRPWRWGCRRLRRRHLLGRDCRARLAEVPGNGGAAAPTLGSPWISAEGFLRGHSWQ